MSAVFRFPDLSLFSTPVKGTREGCPHHIRSTDGPDSQFVYGRTSPADALDGARLGYNTAVTLEAIYRAKAINE